MLCHVLFYHSQFYYIQLFTLMICCSLMLPPLISYPLLSPLLSYPLSPSSSHSSSSWYWATWPCQTSAVWPRAVSCCTSTAATRCSTPSWVCNLTGPGWVTPPWDTCRAAAPSSRDSTCPGPATAELSQWLASAGQTVSEPPARWMTLQNWQILKHLCCFCWNSGERECESVFSSLFHRVSRNVSHCLLSFAKTLKNGLSTVVCLNALFEMQKRMDLHDKQNQNLISVGLGGNMLPRISFESFNFIMSHWYHCLKVRLSVEFC